MTLFPQDMVSDRNGINTVGLMVALVLFVAMAATATSFHNKFTPAPVAAELAPVHPTMRVATMRTRAVETAKETISDIAETTSDGGVEQKYKPVAVVEKPATTERQEKRNQQRNMDEEVKAVTPEMSAAIRRERKESARKSTEISVSAGPGANVTTLISADDFARNKTVPVAPPQGVEKVTTREIGNQPINWYSVRLGFTDSEVRANVLRDVLATQGFPEARTVRTGDGTFHVNAGDFRFKSQAEKMASDLEAKTGIPSKIYEKTVAE